MEGVPEVLAAGEGGLLDVVADPQFASNGRIYFAYAEPAPGPRQGDKHGGATVVARAKLAGNALQEIAVLYRQERYELSGTHFGSRTVFGPDGYLYIGLGDRGARDSAQDLSVGMGKILRIDVDGKPAPGNPFIGREGALPQIWSYGHRNVQGPAFQPGSGLLWASEHGPQGGDEINLVKPGANYGWPVITYGCEYVSCDKIGEGTHKDGMEQPLKWFGPGSVPLTGMAFLGSDRYPQWRGQLVVGALWGRAMTRLAIDGGRVVDESPVYLGRHAGVRDVKLGPDGWLYVAVSSPEGAILRLER
ncbi:PQQ-dependent sugar dehydrogenase [Piscinibacter aquaticus]|uniref:PQQ-dependent sugar dehydrogenase n=1 Tax=Piscinibacter aquaticus TaxID=392597 RepID=A0A5C6U6C6_9BURK|nr:PQQ-dependent sugar dehydrogenase [Piscinibacter aquaticus]